MGLAPEFLDILGIKHKMKSLMEGLCPASVRRSAVCGCIYPLSAFITLHPEAPTSDPKSLAYNGTLSPLQKEEQARLNKEQLANAVHYIWETGEDKYMLRYFHTGFWLSCEKHNEGW